MTRIGFSGHVSDRTPEFFSGDDATLEFNLAHEAGPEGYEVYIDGVRQFAGQAYGIAGNRLTFNLAPPTGASNIMCIPAGRRIPLPTAASWRYDRFDGDGTTTQFTLGADPGGLYNTLVEVGGVMQLPGASQAYTITGTTLTFTEAPPAGTDNIIVRYTTVAAVPVASSLSADAVSALPEDAAPEKANDYLLGYDASADALKKVKPASLGLGAWEFVSSNPISSVSSIDLSNLAAGYDYRFTLEGFCPANDTDTLVCRFSEDNAATFVSSSSYRSEAICNGNHDASGTSDEDRIFVTNATTTLGNDANNTNLAEISLYNPGGTSGYRMMHWKGIFNDSGATPRFLEFHGAAAYLSAANPVDGITFFWNSGGNYKAQGDVNVWRRARS